MTYIFLKPRLVLPVGAEVTVKDAVKGPLPESIARISLPCKNRQGVWEVTSAQVATAISASLPQEQITMLGENSLYVVRTRPKNRFWYLLRYVFCCALLLVGSAFSLCWFHADVGMPVAQEKLYTLFSGKEVTNDALLNIPYAVGVGLGAAFFYALMGKKTVSPLDVKQDEYQKATDKLKAEEERHG